MKQEKKEDKITPIKEAYSILKSKAGILSNLLANPDYAEGLKMLLDFYLFSLFPLPQKEEIPDWYYLQLSRIANTIEQISEILNEFEKSEKFIMQKITSIEEEYNPNYEFSKINSRFNEPYKINGRLVFDDIGLRTAPFLDKLEDIKKEAITKIFGAMNLKSDTKFYVGFDEKGNKIQVSTIFDAVNYFMQLIKEEKKKSGSKK